MTFVPYNYYWKIEDWQYEMLTDFFDEGTLRSLLEGFEEIDGVYYAPHDAIDPAEQALLEENDLSIALGEMYYAKSYQSTRPV